jgi:hypothetical protein
VSTDAEDHPIGVEAAVESGRENTDGASRMGRSSDRRRPTALAVIAAVTAALIIPSASGVASAAAVYQVPASVNANCSTDVTQPLMSWIASVPNNSVLNFGSGACYRIEGTLDVEKRSGLDFQGNGSTFRSLNAPADTRQVWTVFDSQNIGFHNMTIDGSYASGGTFNANLQHAHAIAVYGTSVDIGGVTMTDVAGDCVYFGKGWYNPLVRSSGSVHDSTCLRNGRNAIAVTAGDNILVQHVTTGSIGYDVFDVEPNAGSGFGSNNVRFDSNTIGSFALNAYSVVESGPISNQWFTNNRFVGRGVKVGVGDPNGAGYRAQTVTITGNTSDTAQKPSAINVENVDGLTVTGNVVPMTGGAMVSVTGSCNVTVSGNSYPGGSTEAVVSPYGSCPPPPPPVTTTTTTTTAPPPPPPTTTTTSTTPSPTPKPRHGRGH